MARAAAAIGGRVMRRNRLLLLRLRGRNVCRRRLGRVIGLENDDDDARDNLANYMDEVKEESDVLGTEPDENDLDRGKLSVLSPIL